MRPREFPHRLTRLIMALCYTDSYTYSLPKGSRMGTPGGARRSVQAATAAAAVRREAGRGKETAFGREQSTSLKGSRPFASSGGRDAPDEIHGIARVHGAVAAGGDGQDRLAGPGGGGRGCGRTRDGQRDRGRAAGIRREDPRRLASVDVRRVRRELHRRRREGEWQARRRLPEGLGGGGFPCPGRRVLLRAAGRGTRGDRPRGRRPRLLATRFRGRGRSRGAGGLRPDRGPGNRGGRPRPRKDRPPGTPERGPAVRQGPGRRGRRGRHPGGHGRGPPGRCPPGPGAPTGRPWGGGGEPAPPPGTRSTRECGGPGPR